MKRRNFFKLTGYSGIGLGATRLQEQILASTSQPKDLNLPKFDYATIKVDSTGQEQERTYHQASLYSENLGNHQILDMVSIPAGKFKMGGASAKGEFSRSQEKPVHWVRVESFLLGKYPVTQFQWRRVAELPKVKRELNLDPAYFQGSFRPVESISWLEATEFCDRLSLYSGKNYRLPSEAEWEYACRGNSQTTFAYGDTLTNKLADYASSYAYASEKTAPYRHSTTNVGEFLPNAFGLYDLHGNVREWCADPWHENYNGAPSNSKTWSKGGKPEWRTLRGGSWANKPSHCRSAHRTGYPAKSLNRAIGFRVAMYL